MEQLGKDNDKNLSDKDKEVLQLYQNIYKSTIEMLSTNECSELYNMLSGKLGQDITLKLVSLIAMAAANSATNAIMFYDEMLTKAIDAQFKQVVEMLNLQSSHIEGMDGAIRVLRNRIEELSKDKVINDFAKANPGASILPQ